MGGFTRQDIESLLETLDSNYLGWSSNMAPAIMGAPERPQLAAELTSSFCRTDPEIAKQFARVTFLSDVRAQLPQLKAPTGYGQGVLFNGRTRSLSGPEQGVRSAAWG